MEKFKAGSSVDNNKFLSILKSGTQFLIGMGIIAAVGYLVMQLLPGVSTPEGWHSIHPPNDVISMAEYQGMIWAGGRDGLAVIDPQTFTLIDEIEFDFNLAFVNAILVSKVDGSLWIGHLNGLSRYDGDSWSHLSTADGLPNNEVLSLAETDEGELLVGTTGGLAWLRNGNWIIYTNEEGLVSNSVDVIAVDKQGRIWLGSRNTQANGATMFDGTAWHQYTIENGLPHNSINSIFFDQDGRVWFGCGFSYLGGVAILDGAAWEYLDSDDGLPADHIRLIYQDRLNIIWISTEYSGITATNNLIPRVLITPDQGLVGWEVKSMLVDSHNNLWFGTERGITVIEEWAYHEMMDN